MRFFCCGMLIITCLRFVHAQEYPRKDIDFSKLADDLFVYQDLDLNYEDLYENMVQLLSNPININKASAEELRFLNILSEEQIQNFIRYRNENGVLLTVYELQAVDGFDLTTLYRLAPFIEVQNPLSIVNKSILKRALQDKGNYFVARLSTTLEKKRGFYSDIKEDQKFIGSSTAEYYRFRSSRPGDFSFGFTAKKDAGEKFTWSTPNNQYGFDYISYHAQVQNKGRLKNLIVGDYQNQFAQGLTLGGMFGLGKGAETITTARRSNIGVMPYTSANESGYLHGGAITYEMVKDVYVTAFYSNARRDVGLSLGDSSDEAYISSFQLTGLHRNSTELNGRKKTREQNYGSVINYKTNTVDAGIIYNSLDFNTVVNHNASIYNQFAFNGKQNQNAGAFLNYTFSNTTFFSEVTKSINGGFGIVAGIISSVTNKLDLSILYRKYDRDFHTFYSNAFSENTLPVNESGIYWGWKYRANRKFILAGYYDLFKFPWLRFRSYVPSEGHEWLGRVSYQPSKHVLIFFQSREESKVRNQSENSALYLTAEGVKRNYWINVDCGIGKKLRFKSRAQLSNYHINNITTKGFAIMQDIGIDIWKFGFTARYALFDTDDYDNRQYVYEQDVWLAYSLPAYYGKGVRKMILAEYKINKRIGIWLRYALTRYTDIESIGSGCDTIIGPVKSDIKLQMKFIL